MGFLRAGARRGVTLNPPVWCLSPFDFHRRGISPAGEIGRIYHKPDASEAVFLYRFKALIKRVNNAMTPMFGLNRAHGHVSPVPSRATSHQVRLAR